MGTVIIFLLMVALAYAVYQLFGNQSGRGESSSSGLPRWRLEEHLPEPSNAWETIDGEWIRLKLSEDVTLRLQGPKSAAQEVERFLMDSREEYFSKRAPKLSMLMARLNVEVPEIEEYRSSLLRRVRKAAIAEVGRTREIEKLRADDPELLDDLLETAEEEALSTLDGRPSDWRQLSELRVPRPESLDVDDLLLAKVNHDQDLLWLYSGFADSKTKARRVSDSESIEPWVSLVQAGLALRGADIPAESLVRAFTLVELNEVLKPEKPIRTKAKAVPLLTPAIVAGLPGIRRTFLLKPMDAESHRALEAYEWIRAQASLFLETVITAERVQAAKAQVPPGTRGAAWTIYGDCCAKARRLANSDSGKPPRSLPPYHIGCQAHVDVDVWED